MTKLSSTVNSGFLTNQEKLRNQVKNKCTLAVVESAVSLNEIEKKQIEQLISKQFSNQIKSIYHIKPSLLGGFKVRIGDWQLDSTLLYRLQNIRSYLGVKQNG